MIKPTCKLLEISNPFLVGDVWNITLILSRSLILLNMLNWILKCILRIPPIHILVTGCCPPPHKRAWNLIGDLETAVGGCFQPIQNQPQGWVGGGIIIIYTLNPNVCEFEAKHCILAQNFFTLARIIICSLCEWCDTVTVTVIDKYEICIITSIIIKISNIIIKTANKKSATRVGGRWQSSRWLLQGKGHEHRRLWSKQMIMLVETSVRWIPIRSQ